MNKSQVIIASVLAVLIIMSIVVVVTLTIPSSSSMALPNAGQQSAKKPNISLAPTVPTAINPFKTAAPAVNPLEKTNPFKTQSNAKNPFQ